jgi:anaerobic magnesium-protoporphyrin IX monomethyl ester cyclase
MKVLLVNPPVDNMLVNVPEDIVEFRDVGYPNLGLMYIASFAEKHSGHDIKILDMQVEGIDFDALERRLAEDRPDVVGVPATSFTLIDALLTCKAAKKTDPSIRTVLGGRHGSLYPKETAGLDNVDFVVTNEGEYTFLELLEEIDGAGRFDKVAGIAYKSDNGVVCTGPRGWIRDIDALPFPARHLTPYKKYRYALMGNDVYTTMMTSRGCPCNCLFCDRSLGKAFRFRSPRNVVEEMEECSRMGITEIFIKDDTFTVNKRRVLRICDELAERKLGLQLCVRTRVDLVDDEIMRKLREAGCKRIQYGIESGSQKVLDILKKDISLDQTREAVRIAKKHDMDVLGEFMIGSPGEGEKEIYDTLAFAVELDLDYVLFNLTTPYPGTELYRMGMDEGLFDDFWARFARDPMNEAKLKFWTAHFTEEELMAMIKKVYKRYYRRPGYVLKRVAKVKSFPELMQKIRFALKIFGM